MKVAIVDYGSGNLRSAAKAFERAARERAISTDICVTSEPDIVSASDRIVLPGVGAFRDCRDGLKAIPGMWQALDDAVTRKATPFLGICVGMQLMAACGMEHGETAGFGWIPGRVVKITPDDPRLKIPHMGWNTLHWQEKHPLLTSLDQGRPDQTGDQGVHAYFVHSYHLVPDNPAHVLATTDYGMPITAMAGRDNITGTQFHPEKSQQPGLELIGNFLKKRP